MQRLQAADRTRRARGARRCSAGMCSRSAPAKTPIWPGVALRIVAGVLERLPRALEEQPLLRIDQLGLARRVAEEAGVEQLDAVEHAARLDVARVLQHAVVDARAPQLLVAEDANRLDARAQVVPEALESGAPGKRPASRSPRCRCAPGPIDAATRSAARLPARPAGRRRGGSPATRSSDSRRDRPAAAIRPSCCDDLRVSLHEQQRVPAQIEEVVADADVLEAKHILPDRAMTCSISLRGATNAPLTWRSALGAGSGRDRSCRWRSAAAPRARRTPTAACSRGGCRERRAQAIGVTARRVPRRTIQAARRRHPIRAAT